MIHDPVNGPLNIPPADPSPAAGSLVHADGLLQGTDPALPTSFPPSPRELFFQLCRFPRAGTEAELSYFWTISSPKNIFLVLSQGAPIWRFLEIPDIGSAPPSRKTGLCFHPPQADRVTPTSCLALIQCSKSSASPIPMDECGCRCSHHCSHLDHANPSLAPIHNQGISTPFPILKSPVWLLPPSPTTDRGIV